MSVESNSFYYRNKVAETARFMARLGLIGHSSGNISARIPGCANQIAITPTRTPNRLLTPDDICIVDFDGNTTSQLKPSSELQLHLSLYRGRDNIHAIVHSHPIYATVVSGAGLEIPALLDELIVLTGGPIRLADYALPGTEDLGKNALRALGLHQAVLLRNHGLTAGGRSLGEAQEVSELVERAAQVFVISRLLGRVTLLPDETVELEKRHFQGSLDPSST